MLKRLRRIVLALLALIALAILVPLAYIEGTCQPVSQTASSAAATVTLPPITGKGYLRPLDNTYFTFPEWYIVYSFEDFGHFLDHSSESQFGYLRHILGFWRSF